MAFKIRAEQLRSTDIFRFQDETSDRKVINVLRGNGSLRVATDQGIVWCNPDEVVDLLVGTTSGRDPIPTAHRCRIDTTTADPYYPGHPGYLVTCEVCGPVGVPQDYPRDAQAIANRHEEVEGFERR